MTKIASIIYDKFKLIGYDGSDVDLSSGGDTIKVALVTSSYTADAAAHDFFDDITNEVSATGYTAGGATLANQDYTVTSNTAKFDADNTSWSSSTIVARGAVIYKSTGTDSTSPLIAYVDFGSDISSTASTFQITWHASGILTLSG